MYMQIATDQKRTGANNYHRHRLITILIIGSDHPITHSFSQRSLTGQSPVVSRFRPQTGEPTVRKTKPCYCHPASRRIADQSRKPFIIIKRRGEILLCSQFTFWGPLCSADRRAPNPRGDDRFHISSRRCC